MAVGTAMSGCSEILRQTVPAKRVETPMALPPNTEVSPIVRLLNRAGFGTLPGDIPRVADMGIEAYLKEQFAPPESDDSEPLPLRLRLGTIEVLTADPYDLNDLGDDEINRQLQQAAILRATYSPYQLRERLVDFWSNHFNIYTRKRINDNDLSPVFVQSLVARDQADVIRKHALGKFPAMLKASARSPAMLTYLDNQKNKNGVANENYAREIMELHTLGVDGGYTQKDVQEVARYLTGWTVEDRFLHNKGTFRFVPELHDDGEKVVLGRRIPAGGGESDGDTVLDILARHSSTARFIATKMVRYFYGDENAALIASTAKVYQETGGDTSAMVRQLLLPEILAAAPPILKRPFDFVVTALRATNAETDGSSDLQQHLTSMGQPLYQWPMPDGYPDKTAAWTGSLLARWNFALALANDEIKGNTVTWATGITPDRMLEQIFARPASDAPLQPLRTAIAAHAGKPSEMAALLLSSPAFQWR